MTRNVLFCVVALLSLSASGMQPAKASDSDAPKYTSAQVRHMRREAHTREQFSALADYYAIRERMFERKAIEEMHLWADRSEKPNPLYEKWPRPVDSARNLHDYYQYEASQAAAMKAKYDRLADEAPVK